MRFRTLRPGSFCTAQTIATALLTSKTKMLTYSSIAEAAHDFWVKRKCGKDYRIVVLKSVEVKRVIDYYESKNFI